MNTDIKAKSLNAINILVESIPESKRTPEIVESVKFLRDILIRNLPDPERTFVRFDIPSEIADTEKFKNLMVEIKKEIGESNG